MPEHPSIPKASTSPVLKRIAIWFLVKAVILGGTVLAWIITSRVAATPTPGPTWAADSGKPVPNEFIFAMFPATSDTPLYAEPNGPVRGRLDRMLANSQQEVVAKGWVAVRDPHSTTWVKLESLTFVPPPSLAQGYIDRYKSVWMQTEKQDGDPTRSVTVTTAPQLGSSPVVTFRRQNGEHIEDYIYSVSTKGVTPLQMHRIFGPALAFAEIPRLIACFLVAGTYFVVSSVVIRHVRRRARRITPASTPTIPG